MLLRRVVRSPFVRERPKAVLPLCSTPHSKTLPRMRGPPFTALGIKGIMVESCTTG